jgi:hypothetical protein
MQAYVDRAMRMSVIGCALSVMFRYRAVRYLSVMFRYRAVRYLSVMFRYRAARYLSVMFRYRAARYLSVFWMMYIHVVWVVHRAKGLQTQVQTKAAKQRPAN